jgi:hypothetical protein
VAKRTAELARRIQTIAKKLKLSSAILCNQNVMKTTPKSLFVKNSNWNALPRSARTRSTIAEMREKVRNHEAYQLSRASPMSIILRLSCFSFSRTSAFVAIITGSAVTMKKIHGPRDEDKVSGTRVRWRVGKGRRVRSKERLAPVEFVIASSIVRSKYKRGGEKKSVIPGPAKRDALYQTSYL